MRSFVIKSDPFSLEINSTSSVANNHLLISIEEINCPDSSRIIIR